MIAEIKRLVRSCQDERTGKTTRSGDVCLSSSRSWKEYVTVTAGVLGVAQDEASEWLQEYVTVPNGKDAAVTKRVRRCASISRVKGHNVHQWKDVVTAAYVSSLGLHRDKITGVEPLQLLQALGYLLSPRGFSSILCAAEALLLHLGATGKIIQPATAGQRKVIECTLGHVALVTSFVRYVLEVAAG